MLGQIDAVEEKWQERLFEYVRGLFSKVWMPSHDHHHHLRVWKYAKELWLMYAAEGHKFDEDFEELLLLACFFHDTGLTITTSPKHGLISAKIAAEYFHSIGRLDLSGNEALMNAIEHHDDKSYQAAPLHIDFQPNLYYLLTIADDLDSFGAIGAYRYLEIYMLRKIDFPEIPSRIAQNMEQRYRHLENLLPKADSYRAHQLQRYHKAQSLIASVGHDVLEQLSGLFDEKLNMEELVKRLQTARAPFLRELGQQVLSELMLNNQ